MEPREISPFHVRMCIGISIVRVLILQQFLTEIVLQETSCYSGSYNLPVPISSMLPELQMQGLWCSCILCACTLSKWAIDFCRVSNCGFLGWCALVVERLLWWGVGITLIQERWLMHGITLFIFFFQILATGSHVRVITVSYCTL